MQEGVPHISEAQAVFLEKFFNFRGTITELAAAMDVPLVDMIDILSAPAVRGRINNAKIITELKRDLIAARAEMAALETLQQITSDRHINPLERRRAATAILRATRPIRARSQKVELLSGQSSKVAPLSERFPSDPSRSTSVPPASSDPSPPLMPAVDPSIYIPEEEIASLLKQTTQTLTNLDELCTQEEPAAELLSEQSSQVEPLSERCSPKVPETSADVRTRGKPLTERCHQEADPSQSSPPFMPACLNASEPPPPSQNRTCQEAAVRRTRNNVHTSNATDTDNPYHSDPSPLRACVPQCLRAFPTHPSRAPP